MHKLTLHLDDLRVETFATLPGHAAHPGTVLGRRAEGSDDERCDTEFTHCKTCTEPTCNSCPDTCEPPTCGGHGTCGGFTCDKTCGCRTFVSGEMCCSGEGCG